MFALQISTAFTKKNKGKKSVQHGLNHKFTPVTACKRVYLQRCVPAGPVPQRCRSVCATRAEGWGPGEAGGCAAVALLRMLRRRRQKVDVWRWVFLSSRQPNPLIQTQPLLSCYAAPQEPPLGGILLLLASRVCFVKWKLN